MVGSRLTTKKIARSRGIPQFQSNTPLRHDFHCINPAQIAKLHHYFHCILVSLTFLFLPNVAVQQLYLGPRAALLTGSWVAECVGQHTCSPIHPRPPKFASRDDFPIGNWHFGVSMGFIFNWGRIDHVKSISREATGCQYLSVLIWRSVNLEITLRVRHQPNQLIPSLVGGSNPPEKWPTMIINYEIWMYETSQATLEIIPAILWSWVRYVR